MPKMSAPGLKDCLIFSYISNTQMSVDSFIPQHVLSAWLMPNSVPNWLYAGVSGRQLPVPPLGSYSVLKSQMNKYIYNYKVWF